MKEKSFLVCVAEAYIRKGVDLSEYCFVLPNRRSGTFLLKHLADRLEGLPMLAPEVLPVGDFMAAVAGIDVAPRMLRLMELYLAYCDLRKKKPEFGPEEDPIDFDRFLPWGEVVLEDFSEVDLYDVDAEEVFKNVRDYREITSNFLTDDQKKVIRRYFGYEPSEEDVQGFWKHVDRDTHGEAKDMYLELWEVLPELYREFRHRLESPEKGLATALPGTVYRIAMQKVEREGADALPWKHVVVVGLDWLSTTEAKLFSELSDYEEDGEPVIEFFWDLSGPVLEGKDEPSSIAIRRNRRLFPEPVWARPYMEECRAAAMPRLEEISVPSNAMQTKVAGEWVSRQLKSGAAGKIADAHVAVVLPDEGLLLPLLYSLPFGEGPDALTSVNLTMGWSMRYTSTASLMHHLQRLHHRRKKLKDGWGYLADDLRLFIAQPLVHIVVGTDTVQTLNTDMMKKHRRVMGWAELKEYSAALGDMLNPIDPKAGVAETTAWLESVLLKLDNALAGNPGDEGAGDEGTRVLLKTRIERMQLQVYLSALHQIAASAEKAGVEMRFGTLFHLLVKMTAGEKIRFEGEPLEGLQVMGLMETRALDFDKVIMLSMNDKVMPRRARKRSFIPDSLRKGYGLPLSTYNENRYGYWFYRLMSRADEMSLVYDSRIGEGMRSGGKSRYLMQLERLYARDSLIRTDCGFTLGNDQRTILPVVKTKIMMEALEKMRMSATSLGSYLTCGLQFYYRFVLRYGDDPAPTGAVDPITLGNIFHDVMLNVYFTEEEQRRYLTPGKTLTAEWLRKKLEDEAGLTRLMRRMVNFHFRHLGKDAGEAELDAELPASVQMVADRLLRQVKGVLSYDLQHAPVYLRGGEVNVEREIELPSGRKVSFTAKFDRVEYNPESGKLRVVDFKTGKVHLGMEQGLDSVFNADYSAKNVFQLLLYAHMLEVLDKESGGAGGPVEMAIFDTNRMERGGDPRVPVYGKESYGDKIADHHDSRVSEFRNRLEDVLEEIYDREQPFAATADESACAMCVMNRICRG